MKTEVIMERPAFTLQGSSFDGVGDVVEVSFAELKKSEVGERWEALDTHNCRRALCEERAEVVYKTIDGVAVVFHAEGTSDEPNPTEWKAKPKLKWFSFA